jgi:hypothetical protein
MMLVLLLTAVFGDLLFLPSLLAGPLGWFFQPDPKDEEDEASKEKGPMPGSENPQPAAGLAADHAPEGRPLDDVLGEELSDPSGARGATRHSKLRDDAARMYRSDRPHER